MLTAFIFILYFRYRKVFRFKFSLRYSFVLGESVFSIRPKSMQRSHKRQKLLQKARQKLQLNQG